MLKQEYTEKQVPFYEDYLPLKLLVTAFCVPFRTLLFLNVFTVFIFCFPGSAVVKNPPTNAGDTRDASWVPGSRRSPGVGMATHSSILAWKIPQTEEPGRLQFLGGHKESDTTEQLSTHIQMYLFLLFFAVNKNIEYSLFHYDLFCYFFDLKIYF